MVYGFVVVLHENNSAIGDIQINVIGLLKQQFASLNIFLLPEKSMLEEGLEKPLVFSPATMLEYIILNQS